MKQVRLIAVVITGLLGAAGVWAGDAPAVAAGKVMLPQAHEYQKALRAFMATLTEKDFEHGVTTNLTLQPSSQDPDVQYRNYLLTLLSTRPLVGSKRGVPSVNIQASSFVLSSIEGTNAIMKPAVWPEALVTFAEWDYPGNPYHKNRALNLRAFVTASINLMMLDDYIDKTPTSHRSDWMASQLLDAGGAYRGFKNLLPPEAQKAYADGLKKLARRLIGWGPKREEANMDLAVPIALWYASYACNDPAFTQEVEDYARMIFTDPRYTHPAGYWVERGGLDMGFGGQANFFAVWAALAGDWPFAKEAVARAYRLRAHLCLPEPDGKLTGPTHFNTRLGSPSCADQWAFDGDRDHAAVMVTDEAACWVKVPSNEAMTNAAASRAVEFNREIAENPIQAGNGSAATPYAYFKNGNIPSSPWRWSLWPSWDFPMVTDFAYEFYRKGAYAHLVKLEKSPFAKLPVLRDGTFVTNFSNAFIVARLQAYSVILHTGPVGHQEPNDGLAQFKGPLGLGGGQLSAFWTSTAGPVILGRRRGMSWDKSFETIAEWRLWPIHAVSGCTPDGKVFTSARIVTPAVTDALTKKGGTVTVSGTIAGDELGQTNVLKGALDYTRTFTIESKKLRIETRVKADGKDTPAELYETLPVYLGDGEAQKTNAAVTIAFQADGKWATATTNVQEKVTAIKLTRFTGAVQITFDQPRRVKLSPQDWADTFLSRAICRNIMIDLLESGDKPAPLTGEKKIGYEIAPTAGK
ncbi:MAG: hypothetical protein HY343_12285 [Lentisphaerae bacterium]|nr:hypothetical protein [Lentisphaerota bacterium]